MNPDDSAHGTLDEPASKPAPTPKPAARRTTRRVTKKIKTPQPKPSPDASATLFVEPDLPADALLGPPATSDEPAAADAGHDPPSLIDPTTIAKAEQILQHAFKDRGLLARALTHASIAPTRHQSNERLEFLGDAVLGMVVCEYLYTNYPDLLEGDMTKIKSDAVSRKKCAKIAAKLGLEELLLIGKGMQTRSSLPSSLSAAVVESLLGALYVEAGINRVRAFLMPLIGPMIDDIAESGHHQNFKSVLQQHAQQVLGVQPVYILIKEEGPDHDKSFNVAVELGATRYEACWSRSKKQAEQAAAERALIELGVLVQAEGGGGLRIQPEPEARSDGEPASQPEAEPPFEADPR